MISQPQVVIDSRDAGEIARQLIARRRGYVPEWEVADEGADRALVEVAARYLQTIAQRLNRAPDKNKLAFLDTLGLALVPARAARAPIVFQLTEQATDTRVPANTQLAAPPPPEQSGQIVFETERAIGLAAARLAEVVSLWPGRDQYIDHSEAFKKGDPFRLFEKLKLKNTPHAIYLAHDVLLALAGKSHVAVEFELARPGSAPLEIVWEYWDGQVWRAFKGMKPACQGIEEAKEDGTVGLTRNGVIHLQSDCAETKKTKVNGREAFWLRGLLAQPLPPDPTTALPEVDQIRLSTIIERPLRMAIEAVSRAVDPQELDPTSDGDVSLVRVRVVNEAREGIPNVGVALASSDSKMVTTLPSGDEGKLTDKSGIQDFQVSSDTATYTAQVSFAGQEVTLAAKYPDENDQALQFDFEVIVEGIDPEQAFTDSTKVDVSKPFYPFGQNPQPSSTFYFTNEEVFSKPGATLQIYIARAASSQDKLKPGPVLSKLGTASEVKSLEHLVSWEYWNGRQWVVLLQSASGNKSPVADLNTSEIIELTVPTDMAKAKVNEQEGLWMRVRLVSGSFGFANEITWQDPHSRTSNSFTSVVAQPPSLAAFRLGYVWQHGPFPPEHVWAYNDFQYEDRTYEATWPGKTFPPFERLRDIAPALYLGFDKKLPVDRLGIYHELIEQRGDTLGPEMVWEYWNGANWRELSVEDETRRLRVPGMLSFIGAEDSRARARFGTERHWLRGRLKEDGPPGEPQCAGIFPNAVWASQQQTFNNVTLGTSTGQADQVFQFRQIPVLGGAQVEVQELRGPRANVEWRILAREAAPNNRHLIADLEELLGREGPETDLELGGLRLRRDRHKRVAEVWVRWQEQPHFFSSKAKDRHFVIDRASGRIRFGDGTLGIIPPAGAPVLARQFCAGGGKLGNVAARAVRQLLGGVPGVQGVFNPRPAEGGADGETLERFRDRGPATVRHRGRAIAPQDYETLAREASPAVAVARAVPTRNPTGLTLPGWVTLILIPESQDSRPWPSFGLREDVRRFVEDRASADVAATHRLYVTGPDYLAVDVSATIAPLNHGSDVGSVERGAREALEEFLHPLHGGPEHRGWAPGRSVFLSDVATVLERVEGVDYVEELALFLEGNRQGGSVTVAEDGVVVAGEIRLKLKKGES